MSVRRGNGPGDEVFGTAGEEFWAVSEIGDWCGMVWGETADLRGLGEGEGSGEEHKENLV